MKKLLLLALLLCSIFQVRAAEWTDSNGISWTFSVSGTNATNIMPTNKDAISGDVVIPSTVFNGDTELTVTSIGDYAFAECSDLVCITVPSTVINFGQWVFKSCINLTSMVIPGNVESIGGWAFWGCSSLSSITFQSFNTRISNNVFDGCDSLNSIFISVDVMNYELPSVISQIGQRRSSAHFINGNGDEITELNVTIPDGVTSIGSSAFNFCQILKEVTIPSSVTSIGSSAFYECKGLTSVTIPHSVMSIGSSAFGNCTGLTNVNVIVTDFGTYCNNIIGNPSPFSNFQKHLIDVDGYEITEFVIPEGVTSIGYGAFSSCSDLTSVTIPSSVTSIGGAAFSGCNSLASVTINATEVPILSSAFPKLSVLLVPESSLDDYLSADTWSSMAERIIAISSYNNFSASVTAQASSSSLHAAIGEENLTKVLKLKVTGSINGYDVMIMRNKMINLRHLDLSDANIVANDYEYYSGCRSEDNKLGDNMFRDLKLLSFKAPRTATTMGSSVFEGCSNLSDVTLYEGLTNIGDYAFYECGLERMTVPIGVMTIGSSAFRDCTNLQEIILPDGIEDIGSLAFGNCAIKEISIPEGVKKLHSYTFCGSSVWYPNNYLTIVHLPSTLEVIEKYPFGGDHPTPRYNQLSELILPVGIKRIEGSMGKNSKITELRLPPMLEYVADDSFKDYTGIMDYYVYVVDPINIDMNTFANYQTATLHVPTQSYNNYYWNTQWSQFASLTEFDEPYSTFYIANDYTLADNKRFDGTPDAEFHNGSGFIVEGGDNQALDEVHVASDGTEAASVIDEGNITVNSMTFDIDIAKNKWYFFAFPFRVKVSDIMAPGYYALRWYDGVTRAANGQGGWKDYTGEYLEPGIGYIFQCNTAGTLHLPATSPTFNGQDKENVLEMHTAENDQDASWNFMGNPWLSYFDINDCEFDAPFTIWNGSGYDAYRPGDDDYLLHPFQAFFVQKPEGNNGLHFGHENRYTHHQGQNHMAAAHSRRMAKGINPSRLRLDMTISDGTNTDRTRVVFNSEKQNLYEVGTDAAKFMSANMPQLYTLDAKDVRYAINERPQGEVKLGFNAPTAGTYTIAMQRMDQPMLLRDMLTGRTVSLTDGDYTFDSEAGMFDNRFMLVMDNGTTGIAQLFAETGVSVIGADGGLYISGADKGEVNVYNTAGALVAQQAGNGHTALPRGAYIVKVNGVSVKVAVK